MIPRTYAMGGESAIASYDYTDIAEGTGVILFQGYNTITSGTATSEAILHHLGTGSITSHTVESRTFTNPDTTFNFNLSPFNLPKTVKGTATVRFSTEWTCGAGTVYCYYKLIFQHVDAAETATNIGMAVTAPIIIPSGTYIKNHTVPVPLTETHFKKGESLRLSFIIMASESTVYLAHDPANRDGAKVTPAATYPTKFEVYVPFKLDL